MYFPNLSKQTALPVSGSTAAPTKDDSITGKFDPTALERGAAALKELDVSPNAGKAFEITKLQELTKQKEIAREIEQSALARTQYQAERSKVDAEEKRKNINHQQEQERVTAQYKAQLEAEAYQKKLQDQQRQNEEWLAQQHQQFLRQEEIKRKHSQQEMEEKRALMRDEKAQERETIKARVKEETKGRIQQERDNIDVHLRSLRAKAAEERKTKLEQIQNIFSGLGSGFNALLSDRTKMTTLVASLSAAALGIYSARTGAALLGKAMEARMGKPPLVRETSRWTYQNITSALKPWNWLGRGATSSYKEKLILPEDLSERLDWTTNSLLSARANGTPFRHLCLHGPPGTGKTLFARTLARTCGMDYAIMTGGDVGPLGRQGASELNDFFNWANNSRKGLILFIDEADAFLRQGRAALTSSMSEDTRNALSSFLYHTGTESEKFCVILATNCKDTLDHAVMDRVDEAFEFPLPGIGEREKMLKMFFDEYLHTSTKKQKTIQVDTAIDHLFLQSIAVQTEGFSGRQLAKLCIAMQAAVFGSGGNLLTKGLAEVVAQYKIKQHAEQQAKKSTPI